MTLQTIAGIIGGVIVGLLMGIWMGWGAMKVHITKAGYTILELGGKLYVRKTPELARSLGVEEDSD